MLQQHTLASAVAIQGTGLHSGAEVTLRLLPAPPDTGIVFRRVDLWPLTEIPAQAQYVTRTQFCTCLARANAAVDTVEHLLAALFGLALDNVIIELDAPEVPILDGSAAPFVELIQALGVQQQAAHKRFLRVIDSVQVEQGDKCAAFHPFAGFKINFTLDYDHPFLCGDTAHLDIDLSREDFGTQLSRARTFGFEEDVTQLHAKGLALGGTLDNALLLSTEGVVNTGGMRWPDEPVRHKVLDAVGDLALLGAPLIGEFSAFKSGHSLNNLAVRALLAQSEAWEWVTFDSVAGAPVGGS